MTAPDPNVLFHGEIPANYDRYLVPVLFAPYATDLGKRLKDEKIPSLLKIACGTGVVTRELRNLLPPTTEIVGTDLNADMFEFAKPKFKDGENVRWQKADASSLPFADASFDAVVCQFGVMFVPEKPAAMREAYRVLKPGGIFLFNVWDSMDQNPFGLIAHTTIASFFDHDPPRFYEFPFNLHDSKFVDQLLRDAGFGQIESFCVKKTCRSKSAQDFATGLVLGNPVGAELEQRKVDRDIVIAKIKGRLAERFGSAPMETTMQALIWQARKR